MARRVFFSFHYQNDIWRVNQIRKAGEFTGVTGDDTFYDNSLWEATKRKGDASLKDLINKGLQNSSVTAVLAASETWSRKWVRYELVKSFERGNGLLTLWIDGVKDSAGNISTRGRDPFATLYFSVNDGGKTASTLYSDGADWKHFEVISTEKLSPAAKAAGKGLLTDFAMVRTWKSSSAAEFTTWTDEAARAAGR